MKSGVSSHDDGRITHATMIPYDVESVRQHFPALRGERIPLNNATGSLVYEGAVKV
jgi:hypothetical protein